MRKLPGLNDYHNTNAFVCAKPARWLLENKDYHNNGHRHKANCRHACIQSRWIRAATSTLERRCLVCVFTSTVSALGERRLMPDPTPCTSPNSHELQSSTHPSRLQLFYRAVLAFTHSQRVLLLIPVIVLYHTLQVRLSTVSVRQSATTTAVNQVDRVGKVVKSIFQHTSVGLQLPLDRHKHCRSDASSMPSRLSTVLAPSCCNVSQQLRQSVRHTLFNVTRGRSLPY